MAQSRSPATSLLRSSRVATMQEMGSKITIRKPVRKSAPAADVSPADGMAVTVKVSAPADAKDELSALKAVDHIVRSFKRFGLDDGGIGASVTA